MSSLSSPAIERSRKALSRVLQSMQDPGTARNVAQVLGVSESTVSRTKTEKLEDALVPLYHLGYKVVSEENVCVKREMYEAMVTMASAAMSCRNTTNRLVWDEE